MRILISVVALCSLLFLVLHGAIQVQASRSLEPVSARASTLELIVFESPRCLYCPLIRRDVLPLYERSRRAKDVPLRFVDMQKTDLSRLNLRGPLRIMPTMVLLKNGREISRIGGYIGPELFFHAISRMINEAGQE